MIRYTIRNTPDEVSLREGVRELHPNPFKVALRRLAAYEDTDLTPEQVEALQEENVRLTTPDTVRINRLERIAKQADEHGGIDHLIGLDILAYMGRLAILFALGFFQLIPPFCCAYYTDSSHAPGFEIRKPVATRSALPSGVIRKGAEMPPYFNLLLVISSYPHRLSEFFVQIAHG